MHKSNRTANLDMKQVFCDIATILLGYFVACMAVQWIDGCCYIVDNAWMPMIYTIIYFAYMQIFRMYNITTFYYIDRLLMRIFASTMIASVCLGSLILRERATDVDGNLLHIFCITACLLTVMQRLFIRIRKIHNIGNVYMHILFIGDVSNLDRYSHFLKKSALKYTIDKHIEVHDEALSSAESFSRYLMGLQVDEVQYIYSMADPAQSELTEMILSVCDDMGITVRLIMDVYDLDNSNRFVSSMGTYPVVTYPSVSFDKVQMFIKSLIDIAGAAVGLILTAPIFLIVSIAIKLESPGPIFFRQLRAGTNGKPFQIYKFRSMYMDAEERKKELMARNQIKSGLMFKIADDPRITKVGAFIRRTSIDELPQLYNVIVGNMSLVGTRPPTLDEVAKYTPKQRRRISIKPGITGMWQVNGRSSIHDFEAVVQLDEKYIDEWSLMLDFKLLLQTIPAVLARKGAS